MNLDDFQIRLHQHYEELSRYRGSKNFIHPIFALEHDLSIEELNELSIAIKKEISDGKLSWKHRLAWVVYATEMGYLYSGNEYWQTFEEKTTGWRTHGNRYWLKKCFKDFHTVYGGAKPTGPFANHFTIICWPITNSILPYDLQRHLAHILYDVRNVITQEIIESPRLLGDLIASRTWNVNSRFQQLSEKPEFIGQIAAALLLHGDDIASSLIHSSTLNRIRKDLERERQSRSWLQNASEKTKRNFLIKSLSQQLPGERDRESSPTEAIKSGERFGLEPRLILYPSTSLRWDLFVELQDLTSIALRFRKLKHIISHERCYVRGSNRLHLARGRLLSFGPQLIRLVTWPGGNNPLLSFDNLDRGLDFLLRTECLLRPGPLWVFKIAKNGCANELKNAVIRPGNSYLILSEEVFELPEHAAIRTVQINCDGINAIEIKAPSKMPQKLVEILENLNISQSGRIEIWPVGLVPSRWDGEGFVEWLSTANPIIGLKADHPVKEYILKLGYNKIQIHSPEFGTPIYIELPKLSKGKYELYLEAYYEGSDYPFKESSNLHIKIRDPIVWNPGSNSNSAFFVVVDPTFPTLEQLWDNGLDIEAFGPVDKDVSITVTFYDRGGMKPLVKRVLPLLKLPINAKKWHNHFIRHFKSKKKVQGAYDFTKYAEILLEASELGHFRLEIEREFTPLRWAIGYKQQRYFLGLLDDSGNIEKPQISMINFETPDIEETIDNYEQYFTSDIATPPGLYIARTTDFVRTVIIIQSFEDLNVDFSISKHPRNAENVRHLIYIIELWSKAQVTGNILSLYIRRKVLCNLIRNLFVLIAGEHWLDIENAFNNSPTNQNMSNIISLFKKKEEIAIAKELVLITEDLKIIHPLRRARKLASLITKHYPTILVNIPNEFEGGFFRYLIWLLALSLRLASCSRNLINEYRKNLYEHITILLNTPALARLARFMVLITTIGNDDLEINKNIYLDWDWE